VLISWTDNTVQGSLECELRTTLCFLFISIVSGEIGRVKNGLNRGIRKDVLNVTIQYIFI